MLKRIALVAVLMSVAGLLSAQVPANPAPRAADGKPDLSGIWQTGGISLTGGPQGNVVSAAPAGAPRGGGAAPRGGAAAAGGRGGSMKGVVKTNISPPTGHRDSTGPSWQPAFSSVETNS